jgi:hypothetical protein
MLVEHAASLLEEPSSTRTNRQYLAVIAAHHGHATRSVMDAVRSELEDYSPGRLESTDGLLVSEPEPPQLWI